MSLKYRYIEVTDGDRFRGVLPHEPLNVRDAERVAREDASHAWGIPAAMIDVYVTRTLTPEKHAKLTAEAEAGTLDPDWWSSASEFEADVIRMPAAWPAPEPSARVFRP